MTRWELWLLLWSITYKNMKAIIYYRKSTDRDDKQANSLEHQLQNCRKTANNYSLDIIKEIGESRSAKTEWTRVWFNELIQTCKTKKIDYIIIDEPKRLSRNNIDTSRVIDLLDKEQIKWILWTSREYRADNSRDKFLLQLDLSLSKMDNEDRSKDVKDKMNSFVENKKRFPWKAPFGYKNITIKKWHKDIILDKKEAKVVKEIFKLRLENKAYSTIAMILKKKYNNKVELNFNTSRMHHIVGNKFYYGVFKWADKEIIGVHPQIISKDTYDMANWVWKGVHEKIQTIKRREPQTYHLKWFIKDNHWYKLSAYIQKNNVYYMTQPLSDLKININEKILFDKIGEIIQKSENDNLQLKETDKKLILKAIKDAKLDTTSQLADIESKIITLEERQEKLLDLQLDWKIGYDIYISKNNKIVNEIKALQEQKTYVKNDDFEKKSLLMFELAWSLSRSYFSSNLEWKAFIIRKLMFELSIDTKKELQIAETPLFKSSKMLNFSFGTTKEFDIRTYLAEMSKINLEELKEFYEFTKSSRL